MPFFFQLGGGGVIPTIQATHPWLLGDTVVVPTCFTVDGGSKSFWLVSIKALYSGVKNFLRPISTKKTATSDMMLCDENEWIVPTKQTEPHCCPID